MAQMCPRCGGTSFHYNRTRMRMECSGCGTPISDTVQQEQQMQYDRTYSQAMGHLLAGNWDQSISILKPLLSQNPTDKAHYTAIVRATTEDFQDIAMNNTNRRNAASDAWNKLVRLGGVTIPMTRYSRKRYEQHLSELSRQKNKMLGWLITASTAFVFAGIAIDQYADGTAGLLIILAIFSLYKVLKMHPVATIKQLSAKQPDYTDNPFL